MRYLLLLLLLLPGGGSNLWAQGPTVQWQTRISGPQNSNFSGATLYTLHHRVVSVGHSLTTNTSRPSALWMLNGRGGLLHTLYYPYASPTGNTDGYDLYALAEAPNGDLLLAGTRLSTFTVGSNNNLYEQVLLRTDSLGVLRWVRTYPGVGIRAFAVQALPDGGALLLVSNQHPQGTPNFPVSVPTVMRVDSAGTLLWQRSYGRPYYSLRSITPLSDGSYVLAGNTLSGPPQWAGGAWVQRITLDGDTLRSRVLMPTANFYAVAEGPNKSLVLAGNDNTGGLVAVADSLDRLQWRRSLAAQRTGNGIGGAVFTFVRAGAQPGQVLVGGERPVNPAGPGSYVDDYLGLWQAPAAPGAAATTVWEQQLSLSASTGLGNFWNVAGPGGLAVGGNQANDALVTRLANVPALYDPQLCRVPPFAAAAATPDATGRILTFTNLSDAGPRYAQLVLQHWDFGDGSSYDGPNPPPHTYANGPAGRTVRLTVTNNLGCTATTVVAGPLAAAPRRAGALGLRLFPNPSAGGAVTLALAGLAAQEPVAGEVVDALGRVVRTLALPVAALAHGAALDVAGLGAGVYVLRLRPLEGPVVARLVRE